MFIKSTNKYGITKDVTESKGISGHQLLFSFISKNSSIQYDKNKKELKGKSSYLKSVDNSLSRHYYLSDKNITNITLDKGYNYSYKIKPGLVYY